MRDLFTSHCVLAQLQALCVTITHMGATSTSCSYLKVYVLECQLLKYQAQHMTHPDESSAPTTSSTLASVIDRI